MSVSPRAAPLRNLFLETLVKIERETKRRSTLDALTKVAREVLDRLRSSVQSVTWETASRSSVAQCRRKAAVLQPVRFFGRIAELRETELLQLVSDDKEEVETTSIRIEGPDGHSLWSLDVVGKELVDKLDELFRLGVPLEFLGLPVAADILESRSPGTEPDTIRRKFLFFLVDVRRSVSVLDEISATDSERRLVETWTHSRDDTFIHEAVEELIFQLRISGIDDFPLLKDLIEFTVLQSLSCGRVLQASGRLHMLVAGPPGQGKKLIGLAAKILNPRSAELSASNVTVAGLLGASRHDPAKGWLATSGLLPRAAGGVRFLNMKLSFLHMVTASGVQLSRCPAAPEIGEWLRKHAGTTVRTGDLVREYNADTQIVVSERTVRRRLKEMGAKPAGKGKWLVPAGP